MPGCACKAAQQRATAQQRARLTAPTPRSYGRGGERGTARPEVLQELLKTTERVVQVGGGGCAGPPVLGVAGAGAPIAPHPHQLPPPGCALAPCLYLTHHLPYRRSTLWSTA